MGGRLTKELSNGESRHGRYHCSEVRKRDKGDLGRSWGRHTQWTDRDGGSGHPLKLDLLVIRTLTAINVYLQCVREDYVHITVQCIPQVISIE